MNSFIAYIIWVYCINPLFIICFWSFFAKYAFAINQKGEGKVSRLSSNESRILNEYSILNKHRTLNRSQTLSGSNRLNRFRNGLNGLNGTHSLSVLGLDSLKGFHSQRLNIDSSKRMFSVTSNRRAVSGFVMPPVYAQVDDPTMNIVVATIIIFNFMLNRGYSVLLANVVERGRYALEHAERLEELRP